MAGDNLEETGERRCLRETNLEIRAKRRDENGEGGTAETRAGGGRARRVSDMLQSQGISSAPANVKCMHDRIQDMPNTSSSL